MFLRKKIKILPTVKVMIVLKICVHNLHPFYEKRVRVMVKKSLFLFYLSHRLINALVYGD